MRLIDADALMRDIGETVLFSGKPGIVSAESRGARKVVDRIEAAPTVDAVEVKHGRWIKEHAGNGWDDWWNITCSVCGKELKKRDLENYCPNCGARMDGDTNEQT